MNQSKVTRSPVNCRSSDLHWLLKEKWIFKPGSAPMETREEGDLYVVYSYGDKIAHVNLKTGERYLCPRPEHTKQAKHWQLCVENLAAEAGIAKYKEYSRWVPSRKYTDAERKERKRLRDQKGRPLTTLDHYGATAEESYRVI